MNNFEKFKADLTIERLTSMLVDVLFNEWVCDYCNYDRHDCNYDCEYGIKEYLESEETMTNFEKFKQDLTIERLASMLAATYCERVWEACYYCEACDYCAYDRHTCANDCEYGIKKWLESEVE